MDQKSAIHTLLQFNEKANKLEGLSFTKSLQNSGVTVSGVIGQPIQAKRQGPNEESIDAFVLTIRFFVQDNEVTSFSNMANLYAKLPISPDLVKEFNDARAKTNASLEQPSLVTLNNTALTYRTVVDIFLWGGLCHANPRKKAIYDSWVQDPILFALLQNEFVFALGILLNMIFFTRALNRDALHELGTPP